MKAVRRGPPDRNFHRTSRPSLKWPFSQWEAEFRQLVQQTPCHQSYPCVASRKGNFADCDWFQCFLLCDAEKLGCPKMFSQGSAQRAAIRRRRAFCKITPSKRPFAFGCHRRTSSNWLAPRGAQTEKTRIVDRRQRTPCRACKKYARAAKAADSNSSVTTSQLGA
jgi:hypothetical protein